MPKEFKVDGFWVQSVDAEREINFVVLNKTGLVCRLVPCFFGFDISPLDHAKMGVQLVVLKSFTDNTFKSE